MLPETLRFNRLCLGPTELSLVQLVSALVVADVQVALHALSVLERLVSSLTPPDVNSRVTTPFGGAALQPLQAAVCSPLEAATALNIAQRLLALGASPNISWRDCGGQHTPLSQVLQLRNLRLAELLVQAGADCTATLLTTDLLERSHFDPQLVMFLLDRGADVATPLPHSCFPSSPGRRALLACQPGSDGECAAGCRCPCVPSTAVLLAKLSKELPIEHQLNKLHDGSRCGNVLWLLRRAADCLERLLAAGAPPVGAIDPSGALEAAVAALHPGEWAAVEAAARTPSRWSPQVHHRFPRAFWRVAREVLLVAQRGFTIPTHGSSCRALAPQQQQDKQQQHAQEERQRRQQQQQHREQPCSYWLPPLVVLTVVKHLAPCSQL